MAIAVTCAASYAWFVESSSVSASISSGVISFYFTTNDKFNQDVAIADTNYPITYTKTSLSGMFPGQTMSAPLKFSNQGSNIDATYTVTVKSVVCPADMQWTINDQTYVGTDLVGKTLISKGISHGVDAVDSFNLVGLWPAGESSNTDKNAADIAFMQANDEVTVVLNVSAQQVNPS